MKYTGIDVYEFISKQRSDPIVEWRVCEISGTKFPVFQSDLEFYKKISLTFAGQKFEIPLPTMCPELREQKRMTFRNERNLFRRVCDKTRKEIISQYHEWNKFPVYDVKEYNKRDWDYPEFDVDFGRPFFEQLQELQDKTPRSALLTDLESYENNSTYQNAASNNKNSYLIFAAGFCEDCMYGYSIEYSKDCMDCIKTRKWELCYECIETVSCYKLFFSQNCIDCQESYFLYDCKWCSHCFGCSNLRNKSYCWGNKQLSKEEYLKKLSVVDLGNYSHLQHYIKNYHQLVQSSLQKYAHIEKSESCFGNYIYNSKNVQHGFMVYDCEDCKYCFKLMRGKDCQDYNDWWDPAELCYECITVGYNAYHCLFCNDCWPDCRDLLYCDVCVSCKDCFGCIGLYHKQYCVFNKQYLKEEYEVLVAKLIIHMQSTGEWGRFFPAWFSAFAYNKTLAQEYYPLDEKSTIDSGFSWFGKDIPINVPAGMITIAADQLPENIRDITDAVLEQAILCSDTGRPFRIMKKELEFYRKYNLSLPRKHPDLRHEERLAQKSKKMLYVRTCDKCGVEILSVYKPHYSPLSGGGSDGGEVRVFCEKCYEGEVY